ncbi:MAG TPA: DUF4349 domain-containing protein [Actinomycetales bacterium]|nr:DUF4349 domain-containing protein [Actinomycetales bacterium]
MSSTARIPVPRSSRLATGIGLALAVLLAGCSGVGQMGGADSAGESAEDTSSAALGGGDADAGGGDSAGPVSESLAGPVAVSEERRIRRGSVSVEVDGLTRSAAQVRDLAASLQGYVSDESIGLQSVPDVSFDDTGEPSPPRVLGPGEARLVLRVPWSAMAEAMEGIAALGTELSRWSTETPVETALVDLESRIATQTTSVERIRDLLDQASSLDDVVQLESELSRREADLESIQAQQAALAGKAAMATVTAVLQTADRAAEAEDGDGFLAGFAAGWDALETSTVALLTVLGALLPFAIVAALVGFPLLTWRRNARRRRPTPQPQ